MVRGAVLADEAGAVQAEHDRKLLKAHVVLDLVEAALEEGGVDGDDGLVALAGEARGEGDGVLLGQAHVEVAVRERSRKPSMPVPSGMAAVMPTMRGSVSSSQLDGLAEHGGVGRRRGLGGRGLQELGPVATSNLPGPCQVYWSSSAGS